VQLVMHRLGTVLWHRLKASERAKLALGLENMFHDFGSQRSDQLVLEVRDARKEAERFKGVVRLDWDGHAIERAADVLLVCNIVHAEDLGARVLVPELREQAREVCNTLGGLDVDMKCIEIATDTVSQRTNGAGIAVSLNEHECAN